MRSGHWTSIFLPKCAQLTAKREMKSVFLRLDTFELNWQHCVSNITPEAVKKRKTLDLDAIIFSYIYANHNTKSALLA